MKHWHLFIETLTHSYSGYLITFAPAALWVGLYEEKNNTSELPFSRKYIEIIRRAYAV